MAASGEDPGLPSPVTPALQFPGALGNEQHAPFTFKRFLFITIPLNMDIKLYVIWLIRTSVLAAYSNKSHCRIMESPHHSHPPVCCLHSTCLCLPLPFVPLPVVRAPATVICVFTAASSRRTVLTEHHRQLLCRSRAGTHFWKDDAKLCQVLEGLLCQCTPAATGQGTMWLAQSSGFTKPFLASETGKSPSCLWYAFTLKEQE